VEVTQRIGGANEQPQYSCCWRCQQRCQWCHSAGFGGSGNQANNTGAVATGGSTTCQWCALFRGRRICEASNTAAVAAGGSHNLPVAISLSGRRL
jgi:hypothetical protein